MKKLIAITAGCLITFGAFAGSIETIHRDASLTTDTFSSKSEALNAGFNMYESLESASNRQLKDKLPTFADDITGGISIDSAKVRVEEIPLSRGDVRYRAVVDVNYQYETYGNDN
ncbi:DUF3316 domain-containing protein [Vibrio sp. SCSIO 43137]|uniref:DUF3316 domain-containing protein n=1 Tax=Vibrio sp. SCSIO 43137 TaxID=3021011 RepID=UPI0023074E30|nr:DUF3316 domain-containing protein [Vibrio sp. SCSIO 43137]WCE30246.1 DUF3316 domain-containing protein [Vibrio sp. SCSIO 43137]